MDKLIFDRKETDILNRTKKGYYNIEDIERIFDYLRYICDYLKFDYKIPGFDYEIPELSLGSYLTKEKMMAIINIIDDIKRQWIIKKDLPQTPVVASWDYIKANNLELIVSMLYDFVESIQIDGLYSGTFVAGDYMKIVGDSR